MVHISRHARIAILDTSMLVAFCGLMAPATATGFAWHEWLGLVFVPLATIHVCLSWSWVRNTWRRIRLDTHPRARLNFLINAALGVMVIVVMVSGLVISEAALPWMGISTTATQRWEQLHNLTSSYLLVVAGLHLGLNWSWIAGALRRYVRMPLKGNAIDTRARR